MSDIRDRIYAEPLTEVGGFSFDARVAAVFPDMICRSVPGYGAILESIGRVAARHAQPGSRLYDLGCSLGAATLAMRRNVSAPDCRIVAVDNAAPMIERAREHIEAFRGDTPVELICGDLLHTPIEDASLVVMNFTLQFIPLPERDALMARIRAGMRQGGVLVLAEKIRFEDPSLDALVTELHLDFKRANGYSELEISQKRQALENVLIPETLATHRQRLHAAGFVSCETLIQHYNFACLLAVA